MQGRLIQTILYWDFWIGYWLLLSYFFKVTAADLALPANQPIVVAKKSRAPVGIFMGPPVIPSILKQQQQAAPKQVPTPPHNPNPTPKSANQRFDISLSSDDEEGDSMDSVKAPKKTPSKPIR